MKAKSLQTIRKEKEEAKNNKLSENLSDIHNTLKEVSFPITDDESWVMGALDYEITGIPEIVIWIGPNTENESDYRVKIVNITNDLLGKDCFILSFPNIRIIGKIN